MLNEEDWNICLNSLADWELEYADADPTYQWRNYELGKFLETDWGHKFHHNCLFKHMSESQEWPVWNIELPTNDWDD